MCCRLSVVSFLRNLQGTESSLRAKLLIFCFIPVNTESGRRFALSKCIMKHFKKNFTLVFTVLALALTQSSFADYLVVPDAGISSDRFYSECMDLNRDNPEAEGQCQLQHDLIQAQEINSAVDSKSL